MQLKGYFSFSIWDLFRQPVSNPYNKTGNENDDTSESETLIDVLVRFRLKYYLDF